MLSTESVLFSTLLRRIHLSVRRAILDDVRAAGFDDLSAAHLYVFQLPGPDGLRPTDLADRMNMTKQATNHLLASLESSGYLKRMAGDGDGRTKVIRTTAKGRRVSEIMVASSRRLERDWVKHLGRYRLEELRGELAALDAVVNERAIAST